MKKGVVYKVASRSNAAVFIEKKYKMAIRILSNARPSLLRLFLIYLIITTFFLGLLLFYIWDRYEQVQQKKVVLVESLKYWEEVFATHVNYPDAYFNAAVFAYQLKEKKKAYDYIEMALMIDPLFEDAKKLRKQILE